MNRCWTAIALCLMLLAGDAHAADKIPKDVTAPAGFEMTLFAAPPEVNYPTCLTATPRGELFVGIDDQGSLGKDANRGRIVRCVDTDNDGAADEIKTFTKLDHPRGLVWDDATHALYVLHPPTLSRFYDDNSDGVADRSETLVTAIGNHKATAQQGADHTTNGIRLGIDGWIYIAVGDFGIIDATGSDGKHLTLHGGGIVRVRTDGRDIEIFATGMRNIYDVAIDPFMNVFSRDNTNDGNGWNDRVTFSPPGAYHGYPSRFRRFPQEIVDCLTDTGSGSPCGVLCVDEPALPEPHRRAFYTVEWGQNRVDRHPLVARGAGFTASTDKVMDVPRGIDIDVDGVGRLYVASWAGGGFSYTDPNVGYILRLTPKGRAPTTFANLHIASDAELLNHLASPSGVCRQAAQREILRRGDKAIFADGLAKLAESDGPLAARVAAVFSLKMLRGPAADAALVELSRRDELREFALRALADRKGDSSAVLPELFVAALKDANPRVRLIAAWGLGRLGHANAAAAIVPLTIDPDPLVAHVAVNTLVELNAADPCLAAITDTDEKRAGGAANALHRMHDPAVVERLVARLDQVKNPAVRTHIFRALARLHSREKDWDGEWWQTRPDTTGPYFQPVAWTATPRIAEVIRRALATESPQTVRSLVVDCAANRVDLQEVNERLLAVDPTDSALCLALLDTLVRRQQLSDGQIAAAKTIMNAEAAEPAVRVKTIQVLSWEWASDPAIAAVVDALGNITATESPPAELAAAMESFIQNAQLAGRIPLLARLASSGSKGQREIALTALVTIAESKLTEPEPRRAAESAIAAAWQDPAAVEPLLAAIGRTKAKRYRDDVRVRMRDNDAAIARAAVAVARRLGISETATTTQASETIASIGYEKSLATVLKTPGDATRGKELFASQGCVACHTVSPADLPKGPFLGGIATRYSRSEIFESLVKPSAKIAQGFETQWFKMKDDVLEGFVTRDAADEIELRDANGKTIVLKKAQVKARGTREKSVMPEGLLSNLPPADAANLVAYLESLKAK
ncbi:MAG: hypothetical protein QOF78_4145 [Phycisphaerales bacterium]|nr:hypothetical protein [Phycisphaerales bacterium]